MVRGLKVGDLRGLPENTQLRVPVMADLPHSLTRKLGEENLRKALFLGRRILVWLGCNLLGAQLL